MMELNFKISTHATSGRPVFYSIGDTKDICCLIDTGADTPFWFGGVESLLSVYPDATYVKDIFISGFGGKGSKYPLWLIKKFYLFDGKDKLIINNLYIAVSDTYRYFDVLLSITAFSRVFLLLNMERGTLSIKSKRSVFEGYIARDLYGNEHFQVLLEDDDIAADYAAATQKMLRDNGLKE